MKTKILLLAMICLCVMVGSVNATPFFQGEQTGEASEPGKKMNFQGTLYENGEAVTGERSFTFTIDLNDGEEWTETHPTVQIVEGLYAVMLGSITPMPADLFYDFEERDLTISVGNTVLGTTKLLAPFGLNNGQNFRTAEFNLVVESDTDTATVVSKISGMGLSANQPANAIYASASTDSTNTAIFARVVVGVDNPSFQTGIRSDVVNEGPGWSTPIWGVGTGNGGGTTYGIRGEARGNGNGFSAAARGLNFVESTDGPISRYGALFDTRWGSDNTVPILGTSYGVSGVARGSETNYGVYGSAQGPEGSLNFAGFFQGDVKITNSLFLTNQEGFGSEISNFSVMHRGSDTEVNAMLGNNWIDGGGEYNNRGALFLFADTVERFNRGGADIRRVALRAKDNGWGGSVGALSLRSFDAVKIDADIQTFDGEGHFGTLRLDGSTSNNFTFSADGYPDGNLARMTMSGGLAHTDENNNTYVPELVRLWIERFNDGTSDDERAALELKSAFGNRTTTLNTEILEFRKSDYTGNFLSLGTNNQGEGNYLPYMNMQGNLQHDDGQGNTYTPTLFNLNIWKSSETNEQASLNLNSTEGANANLDVNGLSFGNSEYQPMSLQNNDTGYGRRNPYLSMTSGLKKDDGNGNFYNEQLAFFGIGTTDENNDQANVSLRNTAGGYAAVDPNGIDFNAPDHQTISLRAVDYGNNRLNPQMTMASSLSTDDGNGNPYFQQLVTLGVNNSGDNNDNANLNLRNTNGKSVGLDANGIGWGASDYQTAALQLYQGGYERVNPSFRMTSGIANTDEFGNNSYTDLVNLSIYNQDETNDYGVFELNSTDGRNIYMDRGGLRFNSTNGFAPVELNVNDYGDGTLGGNLQMRGGIQRTDEGQDFSYNPSIVQLNVNRWSETKEVGQLTLFDTEGTSFGIDAYGLNGISNVMDARSFRLYTDEAKEIVNLSAYDDGESGKAASFTILNSGDNYEEIVRIESVKSGDKYGSVRLGKESSSTDQFVIDANGVFGGKNVYQDGLALNYDGTGGAFLQMYAGGVQQVLIEASTGNMTLGGSLSQSSDARLKKNVKRLTSGLAMVNKLRGVTFNWKDEVKTGNKIGFIAQEVEAVLPELVVTKADGFKAVNYAEMSAVLVEAVKELSRQIDELKRENSDLKAELTKAEELESRLEKIEALLALGDSKETVKAGQK